MKQPLDTPPKRASRILLVSQSPRRRRLLSWLGLPFESTSVDTPEDLNSPLASNPEALATHLAAEKIMAACEQGLGEDALLLTFDTIVVHDGQVLGKPADLDDAWRMLRSLSGQVHQVVTGVAMMCPDDDKPTTFSAITRVEMKALSDADIEAWMAKGEFMGCAGAYNIEGQVASVSNDECFQNVAGLPLCHLYQALTGPNAPTCLPGVPQPPAHPCDAALCRECRLANAVVTKR